MFKEKLEYVNENKAEAGLIALMAVMGVGAEVGVVSKALDTMGWIDLEDQPEALERKIDESPDTGMIPLENGLTASIDVGGI